MPDDFKEDELEDVFSQGEDDPAKDGSAEKSEGAGEGAKDGDEPAPLTRADLEALEQKIRNETLTEANRTFHAAQRQPAAPEPVKPDPSDDATAKQLMRAIEMAQEKAPKSVPQLIDRLVEHRMSLAKDQIVGEATDRFQSMTAADRLRSNIVGTYADDIANPQSKIAARALQEKDSIVSALSEFMTPDQARKFRGSPVADQLAYAVGAALSPEQVARQAIARVKADRAAKDKEVERLTGVAGSGSSARRSEGPKITEADRELAAEYGIDLEDEKVRARVLESKASLADDFVIMGSAGRGESE